MKVGDTVEIRNYRDPEIAKSKGRVMRYDEEWVYVKMEKVGGLFRFRKVDCRVIKEK
tara:strand:- start:1431 stop:1601 length:171 start_codon:yes stop_codon:yes gene_type:complete